MTKEYNRILQNIKDIFPDAEIEECYDSTHKEYRIKIETYNLFIYYGWEERKHTTFLLYGGFRWIDHMPLISKGVFKIGEYTSKKLLNKLKQLRAEKDD